jgi:hypothetical protein
MATLNKRFVKLSDQVVEELPLLRLRQRVLAQAQLLAQRLRLVAHRVELEPEGTVVTV